MHAAFAWALSWGAAFPAAYPQGVVRQLNLRAKMGRKGKKIMVNISAIINAN